MGRGLHTVPLCAFLRHASVGLREQVQPPLPPPRRPPGSGGAEGRACGSPAWGGCGGGGGSGGGPLVPWRRLLTAGGAGGMAVPAPGASHRLGVAPFPRPPPPRAEPSCRPSLGPLIPLAVVARRWPAGGGREG